MAAESDCPICGLEKISDDVDRCPQCDSDLSCFKVLDTLSEPEIETMAHTSPLTNSGVPQIVAKRDPFFRAVSALLGVLVVALIGLQVYRLNGFTSQASSQRSDFTDAVGKIEFRLDEISKRQDKILAEITDHIESLRDEIHRKPKPAGGIAADPLDEPDTGLIKTSSSKDDWTLKPQEKSARKTKDGFEFYQALETDTLWDIAKQFYGFGFYYPVLLTHNPDLAIYKIGKKDRIAILKDAGRIKQIYNKITENKNGRLYWYYTIHPGDTPASVRYKYCPLHDCLQAETGFDSNAALKPGNKIRIRLAGAVK